MKGTFNFLLVLALAFVLACVPFAQTTTPAAPATAPTAAAAPLTGSMFLSIGEAYNHYVTPATYVTELGFGVQFGQTNFYNINTLDLGATAATVREDVGYLIKKSGPVAVFATMGGGITSVSSTTATSLSVGGVTLGSVGGGMLVRYDLGSLSKKLTGFGLLAGIRETAVSGSNVSPEFSLKLSYFLK